MDQDSARRQFLKLGSAGAVLAGATALAAMPGTAEKAYAQAATGSLLRTVLDRGKLLVGTGSTNAPWHFENDKGELVGMDIAMAKILAKGLFDDDSKVEFVQEDPAQRIPNITTGKVDIVLQFMTISSARAQLINFSRPYYVEGVALLTRPDAANKSFDALLKGGSATRVAILQNVDAEAGVHQVLPEAQVLQVDTQANVVQALESKRADAAAVDLSTVRWMVAKNPTRYADAGKSWQNQLYGAGVRQGDLDWLTFVNTCFNVAMFGNNSDVYDAAFKEYFGVTLPPRATGFPSV
ncbi:transporter substrate-binding domain-containing protein [Lichenifustis flavocetrariae]|uniref:Transporter substrate-binding domain-containing protein n=1 Tax=Lichenifustis flavocetrariae TaxID=2949735 RepID=A0AA42CLF4_9HYPH|nr:transporter substrate-binding domain-containing protein [Lichenifustis flavocetrariae]MCW6507322.1 transporter substrate-binding domain-containing protein [Lichenifustis flavocetrariae]